MCYVEGRAVSYYRDNIKANRKVNGKLSDVRIRRGYDASYLTPVHRILRLSETGIASRLYLHNDQLTVFLCHDVQVAVSGVPVSVPDFISFFQQVLHGRISPSFPSSLCDAIFPLFRKNTHFYASILTEYANFAPKMVNSGKKRKKVPVSDPPRRQRMVCLMSEEEVRIVDRYLEKYQITNKARWLRETVLAFIHQNMEEDYPTLFKEHDMRR